MGSTSMNNSAEIINRTKQWIARLVIGHGLCPFARFPFEQDLIYYQVINDHPIDSCMAISKKMDALGPSKIETALLILPSGYDDFMDYLDLVYEAEQWIIAHGYEGIYQIASFHPQYQFADLSPDDVRNYTNRSPYPMLHILREESITHAIETHPDIDSIPIENQAKMVKLGADYFTD